ncbi:MAG: hypothetical protein ABIG61_08765 [Planctomycetota bacterium]
MRKYTGAAVFVTLGVFVTGATAGTLWNIDENSSIFDPTNTAYVIENGCVTVNLTSAGALCPTGLGHLASGMENVREVNFVFEAPTAEKNRLHISWSPGGSGKEQFEVILNDQPIGKSRLVDAVDSPEVFNSEKFNISLRKGVNNITLRHLSGDGLRFKYITLSDLRILPLRLNPDLKFPTLDSYEQECNEAGVMLDSTYLRLFAPKKREREAQIIFDYLCKAYDEMYSIVGMHTEYKMVVYHFPENNRNAMGGTSNCTVWYSYDNLELESQKEWIQYKKPHLCGYIEEMAHNFVHASRAQFGWEMIGWTIGTKVTKQVAGNPVRIQEVNATRAGQKETFTRYCRAGYVFPEDLPANQCDRIHAWLLYICEKRYGITFWEDFFAQIRREHSNLLSAASLGRAEEIRNRRYQITIDCFDRLPEVNFKKLLEKYQISLTIDVKSLNPMEPSWDRKFIR